MMYGVLPSFILGFHGCDASVAERIFAGEDVLRPSRNDYDWLGEGVYFWEQNPRRALDFAKELKRRPERARKPIRRPCVIGAVIDPGYCLNLLDSEFLRMVRGAHRELRAASAMAGVPLPANGGGRDLLLRKLDNAVVEFLHATRADSQLRAFDTVRAAFIEGRPLYNNAGFAAKNHIQICVRNRNNIKGYFRVLNHRGRPASYG